jgi:hypothetical protein
VGNRGSARVGALVAIVAIQLVGPTTVQAATTVDLDQWASADRAWQNGNLNGNNSRYPEGGIVPFRLAIEGLKAGDHRIQIQYDATAGGHKAYDFLATWNVTNAKGTICDKGGGARSSMCPSLPSSSSFPLPSDPTKLNGLSVKGAEAYSGTPRRLTIWGGTIQSIGAVKHAGSPNGNSTGTILVRFRSTGSAVLMAWGGHLAQSAYWDVAGGGAADGASLVSGAPWHMRTLQLDGSGNKNQDRSIQPSAIVGTLPPQALAPSPPPAPTPEPQAPAPTPRPPSAPGGGGSGDGPGGDPDPPGAPAGPLGTPRVTPPATTKDAPLPSTRPDPWSSLVGVLALVLVGGAARAVVTVRGQRGRSGRRS